MAQPDEKFHDVGKVDLMRRLQADLVPTDIDLGELRKAIKANGFTAVRRVGSVNRTAEKAPSAAKIKSDLMVDFLPVTVFSK